MAAGKPQSDHEEMRVRVEQAQREIIPAVELEKKEIRMRIPLKIQLPVRPSVPEIVMTTFGNGGKTRDTTESDADRIVGITVSRDGGVEIARDSVSSPQSGRRHDTSSDKTLVSNIQAPHSSPKLGSRLTVQQSHSIIEKTEDLMEFFEDKKKTKQLSKRTSSKKHRTPSPAAIRQSIGLDHLDNLVRLMEQLSNLRDENSKLKNRCDYLESTKTLLVAKSHLEEEDSVGLDSITFDSDSLPRTKKSKSKSLKSGPEMVEPRKMRPRLPSAEDAKCLEFDYGDSSSDQAQQRNRKLFKRSFSTGSLEVPSDIVEQSEDDIGTQRLSDPFEEKNSSKLSKSPETKRKSKFSKWAKVKKVLNKQQLSENISSGIKSIKGLGKGAYLRYGSFAGRELTVPSHSVAESRSVDSGVGSGIDGEMDVRRSTSSNEPPSPTRFSERVIDMPTPCVDDVECEGIWLGPPEWIEKEREKEKELLKQALSESPKSEPRNVGSPLSLSGYESQEQHLRHLQPHLPRRQSSPLLLDSGDEEDIEDLKRSSSCKEPETSKNQDDVKGDKSEKKHKTPWGKMKNIIHTRKESVKKKSTKGGRESDSFGFEEVSETDYEVYDEMKYVQEGLLEGPVSRSTPKASPVVFRQKQQDKSSSNSPQGSQKDRSRNVPTTASGSVDVSALLGGVSDEFTRKLQEWEELKVKRMSRQFKDHSPEAAEGMSYESAGGVSPEFLKKLEEWERIKPIRDSATSEKKRDSQIEQEHETDSSDEETESVTTSPSESARQSTVSDMQRRLTDSFSRKMEEWERQKYRRNPSTPGEIKDMPQKTSFKERQKSKKTKEEKEKEKYMKLREREILRVEREEQKLEKEKMRIEKERLRALEREAKIEKMKGRLSQPDMESKFKNPVLGPLTEYKVTADFARKLHEWEVLKGMDSSTAMYLEAQKRSLQFSLEYHNAHNILNNKGETTQESSATDAEESQMRKTSSESEDMFLMDEPDGASQKVKGQKPPPLALIPYYGSPEPSPGAPVSEDSSLDDQSTETMESMTQHNIASLEKANKRLLEDLRQREIEYMELQNEVTDLNNKLINFRNEHVLELDLYKKQLIESQGGSDVSFDTKHMSQTLTHLEDKIGEIKKFGEQLAMSMEGAAVGKFQTVEGEESINNRLVDLLDKMRLLLQQATLSGDTLEEVSKKSSALHHFEKLYSQAMQLQMQMNNLRLSQLERNKEIMNMKRHLLLQEANNLLLQADVTRREAELLYYKEYSQKRQPIKRWNTYSGKEDRTRANLPAQDIPQKHSIFQRVQRLRSTRPLLPSTTDSDSDEQTKTPPRRESPRVRKRESPKSRKKESPTLRKCDSPSTRKKEFLGVKSSSDLDTGVPERSTDRKEEYVTQLSKVLSTKKSKGGQKVSSSLSVTLPTAKVILPKSGKGKEEIGRQKTEQTRERKTPVVPPIYELSASSSDGEKKPKFPELLIPEWKKQSHGSKVLQRVPRVESDNDVHKMDSDIFIPERTTVTEKLFLPLKPRSEERPRLPVDRSFDSSETSEDTLKYMTPELSPAVHPEPLKFPTRSVKESMETASDPGQSRPNSMIKVHIETHGTPLLLRKPPSGYQLRGRGGHVSNINVPIIPIKRIQPAQELLEDSQRYRSGHSIYLTRILKRYPMKIECRSRNIEATSKPVTHEKENVKSGYVKTIVKQLSREGTPDSKGSPKLAAKSSPGSESPKSEYVSHIIRKLSTPTPPTGPNSDKFTFPLRDLSNGGQVQKLRQAYSESPEGLPGRRYSETLMVRKKPPDVTPFESSSSTSSTLTFSHTQLSIHTDTGNGNLGNGAIEPRATYSSMPMLSLEGDDFGRERASTTSSRVAPTYSPKGSPAQRHKVHVAVSMSPGRSRRIIDPTLSPVRLRRLIDPASPGRRRRIHEPSPIEILTEEPAEMTTVAQTLTQSPQLSPQQSPSTSQGINIKRRSPKLKRKDKSKKGTIEVLCRQSITFDLGVSLHAQGEASGAGAQGGEMRSRTLPIRHSTSSTTSASSTSEIEGATGTSEDKKKSRHKKFMDSSFIQKSKKFFKVSKPGGCSSLKCCGSDREMKEFHRKS
ncbi:uncharacterized protein LOC127851019 isoform X3 [Dreissena polymorpha]|uniref:uncharacterized protein LOC127851019 isoform X3 n=2 Tax=Dreissena polymorpha TaxID=45954 RepID=UPI00226478D1|nr:uncharacterized protein LOC127851019 isoform X3 [Dreissena polymorpha]